MFIPSVRHASRIGSVSLAALALLALPSCGAGSSTLGAAASLLPANTEAYATLLSTDSSTEQSLVNVINSTAPKTIHVANYDEAKAYAVRDEFGTPKTKIQLSDITKWAGDEIAYASIPNPNYDPNASSGFGSAADVDTYSGDVTVDFVGIKDSKAADDFIAKNTHDGGMTFPDSTYGQYDNMSVVQRVGKMVVVAEVGIGCYNFDDNGDPGKCTYTKALKDAQKVFDVLTTAQKGKSLADDQQFVDTMKNSDAHAFVRGYLMPKIDARAVPYAKCAYSQVGANYQTPFSMSASVDKGTISGDIGLKGASKLPAGNLHQIASLPTDTVGAFTIYNLKDVFSGYVSCLRNSDDRKVSQIAVGLNSVLTSYISYLGNEMTTVATLDGTTPGFGGVVDITDESGAKTLLTNLMKQFSSDLTGVKSIGNGEYAYYEQNVYCPVQSTSAQLNSFTFGKALATSDPSCNSSAASTLEKPAVIFGITNNRLVVATSQDLYGKLANPGSSNWSNDAVMKPAIAQANQPSFMFGAVNVLDYVKLYNAETSAQDQRNNVGIDYGTMRMYSANGDGHWTITAHIKN